MTWVQIDDAMADHPKIMQLSHGAFRVQVEGLCYANRNLTDGFVPRLFAHRHGKRFAVELVTSGVWEQTDGGYQIHDFHDYQPTKAEVLELREKRAQAGRLGAQSRWRDKAKPMASAIAPAIANGWQNDAPIPTPPAVNPFLGQSSTPTTQAIDHQIKNGTNLTPSLQGAILDLAHSLPDATDKTVGRLINLAKRGAQQADFHDARAAVAECHPQHPSSYACTVINNRMKERSA
jgi:hypothetical protein